MLKGLLKESGLVISRKMEPPNNRSLHFPVYNNHTRTQLQAFFLPRLPSSCDRPTDGIWTYPQNFFFR
jgi:hypothetical protein